MGNIRELQMVVDFLKERVQTGKLEALKRTENHYKAEISALIDEEVKVETQEEDN